MAFLEIRNVCIKGLSACVPSNIETIPGIYQWEGVQSFIDATGIQERRRTDQATTAGDLCLKAAEVLISDLNWQKESIDALIFVSQTSDYRLPATACILHSKLGLSLNCIAFDISLGCSGWVYGLSVLSAMMQMGTIKRGLLLSGDTITKLCSEYDKATFPLFGDAGTATALEFENNADGFKFLLNTDGKGYDTIICKESGIKTLAEESETELLISTKAGSKLRLDGANVFSFGITKVPKSIKALLNYFNINQEDVDLFTFHQANLMMNEFIRKKLKIEIEKVPYSLNKFANTSCASIPLTLVTQSRKKLASRKLQHVACGFGVGLSWGSVWFETDRIIVPKLLEL